MKVNTDIEQLIARYLNGDCDDNENRELLAWVEASEENKKLFFKIKDTWDASLKKEDITDFALLQFYKRQATKSYNSRKTIQLWRWSAAIAASLVVGMVAIFLINSAQNMSTEMVTFKVPMGSRSEVILADGSEVVLNSGSEITYPETFNTKRREISLNGEAFFKVTSDKSNPFIVKTSDFDVHVTGTQFNVCSYSDNNYSSVTLSEGKVDVNFSGKDEPVILSPGEKLKLDREKQKYNISETEVEADIAWKNGEFRFKKIAFPELIKRLERWYDISLIYTSPELEDMVYSGSFKNQETIWQVLDALKLTSPIDYEKIGFRQFKIKYKPK